MQNALLKFNNNRARRMSEEHARAELAALGFTFARVARRSVSRDGRRETVVYNFERYSTTEAGAARYDRARLTVTFSI